MDKPVSFDVNHSNLKSGVYVSRVDYVGSTRLTTLDIRLFSREDLQCVDDALTPVLNTVPLWFKRNHPENSLQAWVSGLHSLEHALAYVLRQNSSDFFDSGDSLVYVGPGGCLSMFYLVIAETSSTAVYFNDDMGRHSSTTAQKLVFDAFTAAYLLLKDSPSVPGSGVNQCGNPVLHSKDNAIEIIKHFTAHPEDWEIFYPEAE